MVRLVRLATKSSRSSSLVVSSLRRARRLLSSVLRPRRTGGPSQPRNERNPVDSPTNNETHLHVAKRLPYVEDMDLHDLEKGGAQIGITHQRGTGRKHES
jgi:hypothetical protein